MDDCKCSSDDTLERILQDPNSKPRVMQFEYLKRITDNFSDDRLCGEGGFGKVYKGELQNGKMIAVKKFNFKQLTNPDVQAELFVNEVSPLMSLRHPNIVRCIGYCSEKSSKIVKHNGIFVLAESQPEMLLCLEYLTMGSLDKHLKDESSGLDWRTCYKIIKGVCRGLHYLHEGCRSRNNDAFIIHLDLKPANILLDKKMVPKLADFGLSKIFRDKKTQICPGGGTIGYMAPEYISESKISTKADIYSLGVVIIEIITGCKADPDIEQIINKWRNRSAEALSFVDCQQIRSCLEIGKCCIKRERNERPTTREIIKKLSLKSIECSLHSEEGPLCKKTKRSCNMPPENQAPLATPLPCHRDVSVVGGTFLSAKSNGLSENSESLSNQDGVEGSWYSSSAKLALHHPRRLVVPSEYKCPYITPHSKIKVSNLEADVYDVVLRMAESEYSDITVIDYGHVVVKLSALASSLKPEGQVHYFVVNALCKLLFHRKHPKDSCKHYFFSKVGDYFIGNHGPDDRKEKVLYENVVKCFKGAARARPLETSHLLYFPILFHERWYVVVVHIKRRMFMILNSCVLRFGVDSDFHKAMLKEFIPNFSTVWRELVHVDMGFHRYELTFADVPQQSDNFSYDSGIFAMKNLELWDPTVLSKFSEADIPHIRTKYANDMIFNEYNSSVDGRSKIMKYDAEVYEKYYKTT